MIHLNEIENDMPVLCSDNGRFAVLAPMHRKHSVKPEKNKSGITRSFPSTSLLASLSALIFAVACGASSEDSANDSTDDPSSSSEQQLTSHITVTGSNATDVSPTLAGTGFINVVNNGAHVAVTETGSGSINIVNNGRILSATNTGTGVLTINSTATGAVTVTNTGNGRVTVTAAGLAPVTVTHTGDVDFTYP